jgi:hypothetical protein
MLESSPQTRSRRSTGFARGITKTGCQIRQLSVLKGNFFMEQDTPIMDGFNRLSAYSYLLEWEWPEHIESVLRRLLYLSLSEATADLDDNEIQESDYLAAKATWLITVFPGSHPAILHALAQQQQSTAYLERIAENPNAAPETLSCLADHPSTSVRAAVAENPHTAEETLMKLAKDDNADVRYVIAENHNSSVSLLNDLVDDENCYVSQRAQRTLSRLSMPEPAIIPLRRPYGASQNAPRRAAQR